MIRNDPVRIEPPAWMVREAEDSYHAHSKAGETMSSHMLAKFREMPWKYRAIVTGLYREPEKADYDFGTAAHKLILEGREAFDSCYAVLDGPVNERTGRPYGKETKAYADFMAKVGKGVVSSADFAEIQAMESAILNHAEISELLSHPGFAECVCRAEWEGVPCQTRMDWFSPEIGIVDLKTCRDISMFERDARSYGYMHQMAFYRAILRIASGVDYPVHIVAVDKTDFHVAGYWICPPAELDDAERQCAAALRCFRECRARNSWPTGFERRKVFNLKYNG